MFTKLFPAMVLTLALAQAACSEDINPAVPSNPDPVTEAFTGTLTQNGAVTHPFSAANSGAIRASIVSLAPDSSVRIGESGNLERHGGNVCDGDLER
jgi:hypothetical protein